MSAARAERLKQVSLHLGEVVADRKRWPDLLDEISRALDATGAALLPRESAAGFPCSPSVRSLFEEYLNGGWHERDPRRRGIARQLRGEVVTDYDIITPDEMRKSTFFNELLAGNGLKWWAGVGFFAGPEFWCLAVQRTERQEQFLPTDKPMLQDFSARLTEVATLSRATGRKTITCFTNALDHVLQAALTVDRHGRVIHTNASAEALFDDAFRVTNGKLVFQDRQASLAYSNLLDRLRWTPEGEALRATPVVVRRPYAYPLLLQALPIDGEAQSPFGGARVLLLLREIRRQTAPATSLISEALEISPAEARLVAHLASGHTIARASSVLGIARETARNQLKSVYAKTDTHSQSGLIALLASLPGIP